MKLTPKSRLLLAILLVLGGLAVLPNSVDPSLSPLPSLPAIDRDQVKRIEISRGPFEKIILETAEEDTWQLAAPIQAEADPILVKNLLREFDEAIPMDARVDEGNREAYGLQNETRILVEIFGEANVPLLLFELGGTTRGGASFVRLEDSEDVYRARVGPRHRIDMDAPSWRNQMVVSMDPEELIAMRLSYNSSDLVFERTPSGEIGTDGEMNYGPWQLPGIDLDQKTAQNTARSLSKLRASEILSEGFNGGFEPPAAVVVLQSRDGTSISLRFGTRTADGGAFVRRDDNQLTYRVAKSRLDLVTRSLEAYQDLQVVSFEPSEAVDMTWEDLGQKRTLTRQDDGVWIVTEPSSVDSDLARILSGLTTIRSLRAAGLVESGATPLTTPLEKLTIRFSNGTTTTLVASTRISTENRQGVRHIEVSGSDRRYVVPEVVWGRVRAAFGRGG